MCKKMIYLVSFVLVLGFVSSTSAVTWDNGSGNGLWSTPQNWSNNLVPTSADAVSLAAVTPGPTINSSTAAVCLNMLGPGQSGTTTMDIIGGSLATTSYWSIGQNPGTGNGTANVSNNATVTVGGDLYVGNMGNGTLNVSGNSTTITVGGQLRISYQEGSDFGHVNLYSGLLDTVDLTAYSGGGNELRIDITGGTLIVRDKTEAPIENWVTNGYIVGYDGDGVVIIDETPEGYDELTAAPQLIVTTWTNNTGNGLWSTAGNWSTGVVPTNACDVHLPYSGVGPTINSSTDAVCNRTLGPGLGASGSMTMNINGGSFKAVGQCLAIGQTNTAAGTVNVSNDATVDILNGDLHVGNMGNGTLNVGTLGTGDDSYIYVDDWLRISNQETSDFGRIYLYSGTLSCENLYGLEGNELLIDIHEGTLIVRNKIGAPMQNWVDNGYIVGYGDTGAVIIETTPEGWDKLTAIPGNILNNGVIQIGVDFDMGGAITFLADADNLGINMVNSYDLGREIQQSYYSGPVPFGNPHPYWAHLGWNPVCAGDCYGYPSEVVEYNNDGTTLYVKTIPKQWPLNNVPAECIFEKWITLGNNVAKVSCKLTNSRTDTTEQYNRGGEMPAAYSTDRFYRIFTYTGDAPFTNGSLTLHGSGEFEATENWAALVDNSNWGFGVFTPGAQQFGGEFFGTPNQSGGNPTGYSTGYVSPKYRELLDYNIVYTYDFYLIVGNLGEIRSYVNQYADVHQLLEDSLPDYRFEADRQHWSYLNNTTDTGWPIEGKLRVNLGTGPQMVSPPRIWDAEDVPKLYIRARYNYNTTNTTWARIFWKNFGDSAFTSGKQETFAVIPDGQYRTYEVDLSSNPSYSGKISRLRFDPLVYAEPGKDVDIEFISHESQ